MKVPAHTGLTVRDCRKEKEDTESHKIAELYEFLKDSSRDLMF